MRSSLDLPRVIAHRGDSGDYPENTMTAFDAAIEAGCDGVELDVQLSRDGVPVVYHDRTLRKIGGGDRAVRQLDWSDMARLDAGAWRDRRHAGERVPSLDAVLDRYGTRTRLLLEIKVRPGDRRAGLHLRLADAVVGRLHARRLSGVMVLSFDGETLGRVSARAPDVPTVLNLAAPPEMTPTLVEAVRRVDVLSLDVETLTPGIVRVVHEMGKPVLTFTCNTLETLDRAVRAGADGFMTDHPAWLRRVLAGQEDSGAP